MAVLYGNDAFLILALSTKKWYSNFLKKVFVFQKIQGRIQSEFHTIWPVLAPQKMSPKSKELNCF